MVSKKKKPMPAIVGMTPEEYNEIRDQYAEKIRSSKKESEAERQKRLYREERARERGEILADE
jgi:hypothetical protein